MKTTKRNTLFVALFALFFPYFSSAQLIGTSAYMTADNVEIGINDAGHEGAPLLGGSNNRSNQPVGSPVYFGFVANPQMDGWTDYDGDFFTPGSPENGFGLEIDGVNYSNNAAGTLEQIPGAISGYSEEGDCIYVDWDGSIANVDVHIVYRLITSELYYTTEITLTNSGPTDLTDVYYYRNLDPDNNVTIGAGYSTQNTIVAQPSPTCEKALVTATQATPWASYIGLGAIGENFRVSYGGFTNRDASNIWNAVGFTGAVGSTAFADQAISLAYRCEDLPAGESETFLFTVVLDASQIDAALSSLYYFDYLGGEGVIDECAPVIDTASVCAGDPVTISIDGPSADDYVWEWSPPVGLSTTDGPTTEATPAATTEYTVVGTPSPLCLSATIEKTIVVEVTPSPIIEIIDPGPQCGDFDLTMLVINNLEGSPVDISFYSVVPDSIDQVAGLWPSDFMSVGDVVYVMMANATTGCFTVEPIVIDFSGGAQAGADNTDILCNSAGSALAIATLLDSIAEPGGIWEETSPVLSGGFDSLTAMFDASGVDAGTYTFNYIALGLPPCENDTAIMTITVNEEALAGLDGDISVCNTAGTTTDLDDLLDGNNAVGIWTETTASGQFDPLTGVFDASGLASGDYTFTYTVTALAPCGPDVADFTVTILPGPPIDAGMDLEICEGDPVTLTGTGAGAEGVYTWSDGVTDGVAFEPAISGTYTVVGVDEYGCESTDDLWITVNPSPDIIAGTDVAVCDGDMVTLTADGAGVGGVYVWTGGITDGVGFVPEGTTEFMVTGTDAYGCSGSDIVEVMVNELPAVDAGVDPEVCDGDAISLSGAGAGPGAVYSWSGGISDGLPFMPDTSDEYILTGTDTNGCTNTDTIWLSLHTIPVVVAGEDVEVCDGDWVILSGSGAGPGATYEWTDGGVDGMPFVPGETAMFTVTATDINGCTNTDDVWVMVNPLPLINAGPDHAICIGDETVLAASGAGEDGVYSWSGGISDGVSFTPWSTAVYTVTGMDIYGCENTDIVEVIVNPLPAVEAGEDIAVCDGDEMMLEGSGAGWGATYAWTGGIVDGVMFTPDISCVFTVTGTDMNGCSNTDVVDVVVNPLPEVAFMADELTGCAPFYTGFSSLEGGMTFNWEFGDGAEGSSSTPGHTFANPGLYDVTLTITSIEGCTAAETYDNYIDVADAPVARFSYGPDEITVSDTRVEFFNSSINASMYMWNFGDDSAEETTEDAMHEYEPAGNRNYTVTLLATNDYGCEDKTEQVIQIKDELLYYIPNTFTPDGDQYNEEFKPIFFSGVDIFDYHLTIFNRWGEIVFESYNTDFGWSGTYGDGRMADDGVYIWKIEFGETMSDKIIHDNGHVTLLK